MNNFGTKHFFTQKFTTMKEKNQAQENANEIHGHFPLVFLFCKNRMNMLASMHDL